MVIGAAGPTHFQKLLWNSYGVSVNSTHFLQLALRWAYRCVVEVNMHCERLPTRSDTEIDLHNIHILPTIAFFYLSTQNRVRTVSA